MNDGTRMLSQAEKDTNAATRGYAQEAAVWAYDAAPRGVKETFQDHVISSHPTALKYAYEGKDFDAYSRFRAVEKDREDLEKELSEGVRVLEEADSTDLLYVPNEYKEDAKQRGGSHRWVTEKKFNRFKDAGFEVEKRKKNVDMPYQHNHEDTTMRTNELVLMFVPGEVKEKRDTRRKLLIEQQMPANSSPDTAIMADLGKRAYSHFRGKGMDHDNAIRMSNKVEKGQAIVPADRERGEVSVRHTR